MRGLFVTATGTGVGKSVLSASLLAAIARSGEPARAHKPVLTGTDEEPQTAWPPDDTLLALAADMQAREVAPLRYGPPVSPHLAAAMAGERIEAEEILARARDAGEGATVVVEGIGGLLVPLTESFSVRDMAAALGLPVLIAAAPGLGTINHTLLSLESARSAGLDVRAVVLTPWPGDPARKEPTEMEASNRETIARIGQVEVATLERLAAPERELLADAGERLPWRRWIERRAG